MTNRLENAEDKFIDYIGKLCNNFGLNKFVAQLYAVLYLNGDELMSLDDIAQRLKVSKGNVSINIRILENWGVVHKIWQKGSRKDYYKANPDIERIFFAKIKSAVSKRVDEVTYLIDDFKDMIDEKNGGLTKEEKARVAVYLERLKKVERIKNMAGKFIKIAGTFFPGK